jgi:hypothetical protein
MPKREGVLDMLRDGYTVRGVTRAVHMSARDVIALRREAAALHPPWSIHTGRTSSSRGHACGDPQGPHHAV